MSDLSWDNVVPETMHKNWVAASLLPKAEV